MSEQLTRLELIERFEAMERQSKIKKGRHKTRRKRTARDIAASLRTGLRSIQQGRRIKRDAIQQVTDAWNRHQITTETAYEIARHSPSKQLSLLSRRSKRGESMTFPEALWKYNECRRTINRILRELGIVTFKNDVKVINGRRLELLARAHDATVFDLREWVLSAEVRIEVEKCIVDRVKKRLASRKKK